jgi:hypothetical protein
MIYSVKAGCRSIRQVDAYCMRVTSKYVYNVCSKDVFMTRPEIRRVKSEHGVSHVRPHIGCVVEVVQNWRFGRFGDSVS